MRRLLILLSSLTLCSCAATLPQAPALLTDPRPPVPAMASPEKAPMTLVFTGSPARSVGEALYESMQTPQPWRFHGGVLVYTASQGSRYLVPLALDRLTTLRFGAGEVLYTVSSGLPRCEDLKTDDPDVNVRCLVIQETSRGEGETHQAQVSLRPGVDGLKTNVMVSTSWDAYDVEIVSTKAKFVPVVQWEHPAPVVSPVQPVRHEVMGVGYALTSRRERVPVWMPVQVWDDTKHTYIRFPDTIGSMKLPLLYEVAAGSMAEQLVNYRVYENGRLMVADGVYDGAVLRVGKDPTADLVDLRRTVNYRYLRCPSDPECPSTPSRVVGR